MKDITHKANETFNNKIPLYNIRILRSYIDYVRTNYPNIHIDKILTYAGVTRLQFNDYGYWCNQHQMNRLQEILIKETGNKNISRDTGRNLIISQNIIALYILGFINPFYLTGQIERVYKKLSRAVKINKRYLGNNRYELIITPLPGVTEEQYQCKNRIGSFEGLLKYFLHEYPQIEHPECIHKGKNQCRYIIYWNKPRQILNLIKIRNNSIILCAIISIITYIFFPLSSALLIAFISSTSIMSLTLYVTSLEKDKMQTDFSKVSDTAEDYLDELNIRYSSIKLIQEVGEITTILQNEREISSAVSQVMSNRLDYVRGAILLAKNNKKSLIYTAGYGFTEDATEMINNPKFLLEIGKNNGVLQKVFEKQEPVLVEDINRSDEIFTQDDIQVAQRLKMQSMICVPIVHEGESLGVIVVDSLKSQREFREGDINLLMAVASQTALSIANARSFQKLQESEKKHRTLVETIRDIVYTIDLEGRFTYISPMVAIITGYEDKELLGRKFTEIVNPPYKNMVWQKFSESLKSGELSTYEIEILSKDGKAVPIEFNAAPLTDNKGNLIGRIGVARDITRRYEEKAKRQEMEMRALTQDKLASLGEIATGVAHEINQPLSYIKIILESTLSDIEMEKLDKEELSGDFNESLRQVGKITNIISHLRTFGRSDVTSFSPVKLSRILDDTLILMKERLRIRNITIDIHLEEHLPMLYANHAKLEQVFVNLIQNSMDAIEEQGKGEIILTARVENNEVLILYSDTGAGIDPMVQQKIFDPFFTTKEPGKGTGIGLSIVYGILQEHEGVITCESEMGKGATFRIKLPIYSESTD